MAKHHGKNGVVKFGATKIAHITKFTVTETAATADSSEMGLSWEEHIAGMNSWSGSVEGYFDPADTNGQAAIDIGESGTFGLYSDGDAATKKYLTGTATVTSKGQDVAIDGVVKFSINIKGNGALTTATAA